MENLDSLFSDLCGENWAKKRVSHNDKDKGGLYVTKAMQCVMAAAGNPPVLWGSAKEIEFELIDTDRSEGHLTYYESQRSNRPEARMGREMISSWLKKGDQFYIGWTGKKLIAAKYDPAGDSEEEKIAVVLGRQLSLEELKRRAISAPKTPAKKSVSRTEFERDPSVIAYVKKRAAGVCEMSDCVSPLFRKPDGSVYLEVHHVEPLSEGGKDSVQNTAALCPNCHRAQHHAVDREELRSALRTAVLLKEL